MTATARGGEMCFAYLKAVCPREIGGFLPPSPISRQRPPAPGSPCGTVRTFPVHAVAFTSPDEQVVQLNGGCEHSGG